MACTIGVQHEVGRESRTPRSPAVAAAGIIAQVKDWGSIPTVEISMVVALAASSEEDVPRYVRESCRTPQNTVTWTQEYQSVALFR